MPHLKDWRYIDDTIWNGTLEAALKHHAERKWLASARNRSLGLIFFNPSLRTRTSMEMAAVQLGAHATTLNAGQGVWGFEWRRGAVMDGDAAEHIREAIGVLSRYYDALAVRVFASMADYDADKREDMLETIIQFSSVPVINLESAFYHPCQALGDAATLMTHFGGEVTGKRFVLTWAYHPKALPMAVPNSALLMASRLGMKVTLARPDQYALDPEILSLAGAYAEASGGSLKVTNRIDDALHDADIVYAKAWGGPLAYTDPEREKSVRSEFRGWRVTEARMRRTNGAAFMHCLPVRRNVVVDDSVLDGPGAIHLLQAEFRLHAQKAILEYVWNLS